MTNQPASRGLGICVLSVVVAFLSALSDHVPVTGRLGPGSVLLYGAEGIVNDFTIWLVCAIAVARFTASGWRRSASAGCAWSVVTVWFYLAVEAVIFHEGHSDGWGGIVTWTVLAALGGAVGGLVAALYKRFPIALAPLVLLGLLRLRDSAPWHSPVGVMHHVAILAVVLGCLVYWAAQAAARLRR